MDDLIPKPFRFRPEMWEAFKDNPKTYYIANALIAYEEKSNLPIRAWGDLGMSIPRVDVEAATKCKAFQDNVVKEVAQGKGLFIYGGVGNGKTTWAYRIAREYLESISHHGVIPDRIPVYFVNVPSLLNDLKLAFNDPALMSKINHRLTTADLVIFDDIGAEKGTEWASETLYQYINERYANGKSMIFTSNLAINQLDMRVADRIREVNQVINFKGSSRREHR